MLNPNDPIAPGDRYKLGQLTNAQQFTHPQYQDEACMIMSVGVDRAGQYARVRLDLDGGTMDVRPHQLEEL